MAGTNTRVNALTAASINGTVNASQFSTLNLAAAAGDTIELPAGTYTLSGLSLSTTKHFRGAGKNKTILQVPASTTGISLTASAPSRGSISNLSIQLTGNNAIGVDALAMNRWDISNVDITTTGGTTGQVGIWFRGGYQYSSYYNNLIGCQFNVTGGTAVRVTDCANQTNIAFCRFISSQIEIEIDASTKSVDGVTASSINAIWIQNCNIEGPTGTGISIGNGIGGVLTPGATTYDVTVENCRFEAQSPFSRTHVLIGPQSLTAKLINNWYTGGTKLSDSGIRTTVFEARNFGGGVNSQYNWISRQNVVVAPNDAAPAMFKAIASVAPATFQASHAYPNIGAYVQPTTPNGHVYQVTVAGTSTTEPSWHTDGVTPDTSGTVTFLDQGVLAQNAQFMVSDANAGDVGSLSMAAAGASYGLLDAGGTNYRYAAVTGTNGKCQVNPNGSGTFDICALGGTGGSRFMDGATQTVVATVSSAGLGTFNGGVKIASGGTPLTQCVVYSQSLTPTSVALNTTATQTFTVTGLTTADKIIAVNPPSMTAGTGIVAAWASGSNTLSVQFSNNTGGSLTPASGTYNIVALRS